MATPLAYATLVETSDGQGFVVGRSFGAIDPNYTVLLLDHRLVRASTVRLIDPMPINHPDLPAGLRPFLLRRLPPTQRDTT